MPLNLDTKRGPNGLPLLHLPRAATEPPAPSAPATEPAAPQAPSTAPDALDVLRSARPRRATKAQLEKLADRWRR